MLLGKNVCLKLAALAAVAFCVAPLALAQDRAVRLTADEQPERSQETDYWIGVRCAEVPGLLRAQLELPEGQGVLIDQVIAGAPAEQAGLKTFDVIVLAAGKKVTTPRDVADAVAQADGDELEIEYLRGGKQHTVTVKPAPRPGAMSTRERDQRSVRQWFENLGEAPLSMRFLHPGMVLPPGVSVAPSLPNDMTVTIEKHGEKPAKITVKQGDKTWQAGEESLDKLPEEARNYVQRMLGLAAFEMRFSPPGEPVPPPGVAPPHPPAAPGLEERLNRRLDEMNRQIEQLRKIVEKMGEGR
ncbi:MAG TPA: PDZ domain-containing protein [Pirellulales bacterium]|nr:PDZ domain-containing protein [Pirellulales bacterium]